MKPCHYLAYLYHKVIRYFHRREGDWQSDSFAIHHQKMKLHKERMK